MSGPVTAEQRFTKRHPCPICGGHNQLPSGRGVRCYGYLGSDRRYAHCTRDESANGLPQETGGTYAHRLAGSCHCGVGHGTEPPNANGHEATNGHHPSEPAPEGPRPTVVRTCRWLIATIDGEPIEHVRDDFDDGSKKMRWERGGKNGLRGLRVADLPLYGADEISTAKGVIIVEGEQARDALQPIAREIGLAVVGTVTGAKTRPSDDVLATLPDVPLFVWPDSDDDGEPHMAGIAAALVAMGRLERDIKRIAWDLARPGAGDDAADFVQALGTTEDLAELLVSAPPIGAPVRDAPPNLIVLPTRGNKLPKTVNVNTPDGLAALTKALGTGTKDSQATRLVGLARAGESELFHDPSGDAYITFNSGAVRRDVGQRDRGHGRLPDGEHPARRGRCVRRDGPIEDHREHDARQAGESRARPTARRRRAALRAALSRGNRHPA